MATTALYTRSEIVGKDLCHVYSGSGDSMRKRPRMKTVTWPIDEKICEVRHFLVDDAPSSLGVAVREFSQCQQGNPLSSNEAHFSSSSYVTEVKRPRMEQDNHLMDVPPGFGPVSTTGKLLQLKVQTDAAIAVTVSWHAPRKFFVDASWLWAEGEETLEVSSQQERERRSFEAFYPRLASIPDSPLEPLESTKEIDDALVAHISLVPVEEQEMEDEDVEQGSNSAEKGGAAVLCMSEHRKRADPIMPSNDNFGKVPTKQQQNGGMSIADANIAAAAAAACMAVKALGESDLVDEALLFELLKNPSLLKSLTHSDDHMKGKSQGQESGIVSRPSAHQEPLIYKLPSDHGAYLDRSPVSVLAQWGDYVGMNNPHKMAPIAYASTHVQQSANLTSTSMNLPSSTSLKTSHPCSDPESHSVQRVKCAPRMHKQIHEISTINSLSHSTSKEVSLMHAYKPGEAMRSQPGPGKASQTNNMLEVMTSSPFSVHPTTKEMSQRNSMQVEPPKHLSTENISFQGWTGAFSASSKTGGRANRLCMYFNTPRGCRNGESCAFVHQ